MRRSTLMGIYSVFFLFIVFSHGPLNAQTETKLLAEDGIAHERLGNSISIYGDRVGVGELCANAYRGSAYIFRRNGTDWEQEAKLTSGDIADGDYFGCSVSISGDYFVAGAYGNDDSGERSGSAYVFRYDGSDWNEEAKLTANDPAALQDFGFSVSIDGEYVVVGAYGDNAHGNRSGAAYVFKRNGTAWAQQAKLVPADGASDDDFGVSVAISGDRIVVGAQYDDDNGAQSGSAYVFKRTGAAWLQEDKLIASDGGVGDRFGKSVSINGICAVVGAPSNEGVGGRSGSAYVFRRNGTEWTETAKLTASDGASQDNFGNDVSICGDYVAVGALEDDDDGTDSGSAYVFRLQTGGWSQEAKLTASDGAAEDEFGLSVAVYGNYVGAGSYWDDNENGENAGSAYIYEFDFQPTYYSVPDEYAAIAEAMSAATMGSIVLVGPGTYHEVIEMKPGVRLLSQTGPSETAIVGPGFPDLVYGAEDAVIAGFTIADNDNGPGQTGNGIYSNGDNLVVTRCIIRDNRIGIYLDEGSEAAVYHNTIDGNVMNGIYMQVEPSPEIYNNIISNSGEGIHRNTFHSLGDPFIQYNCYFGNTQDFGYYGDPWTPQPGAGEIFQDPLFVGGTPFDYHLTENSPCIDAGDPATRPDPDNTRADIGAYWYMQTGIADGGHITAAPEAFVLYSAYPNPFNPETTIAYDIAQSADVTFYILDLTGRQVRSIPEGVKSAGKHTIRWDGRDESGNRAPSGVYFCRVEIRLQENGKRTITDGQKIILMK